MSGWPPSIILHTAHAHHLDITRFGGGSGEHIIVTQVGFCDMSPRSLSQFLSTHKKALLQ